MDTVTNASVYTDYTGNTGYTGPTGNTGFTGPTCGLCGAGLSCYLACKNMAEYGIANFTIEEYKEFLRRKEANDNLETFIQKLQNKYATTPEKIAELRKLYKIE